MHTGRWWVHAADKILLTLLAVWLIALPLPFGGVIDAARPLVILCPIVFAAAGAAVRMALLRDRAIVSVATAPYRWWSAAVLVYLAAVAFQLLPLPGPLVRGLSPQAASIWSSARQVVSLAGTSDAAAPRLTVNPAETTLELFRIIGLFAAFSASAMLIRDHQRRLLLAPVLAISAWFQVLYGVREATLGTYAIWGWRNTKIFNRVTGTFVNPNHYAHYLAVIVPVIAFAVAALVRDSVRGEATLKQRIAAALSRHAIALGLLVLSIFGCLAGILLGQSRGALFSLIAASALMIGLGTMMRTGGRRAGAASGLLVLGAAAILVVGLVYFLGSDRTVERFRPSDADTVTLGGRRTGLAAGLSVARFFPLTGSGAGTFGDVVSMVPAARPEVIYEHVHNDFLETAATIGCPAALVIGVCLVAGIGSLGVITWGPAALDVRWRRRAFGFAALTVLAIVLIHGMIDFNFYIPANPATVAVILGAAAAPLTHDMRTRRPE